MTSIWFSIFKKNETWIKIINLLPHIIERLFICEKFFFFQKTLKNKALLFQFSLAQKKILWLNMEGNSEASIFHFTVQAAIFWSCSVRVNTVDRKANVFYGNTVAGLAANPALLAWITEGQLRKIESYIFYIWIE